MYSVISGGVVGLVVGLVIAYKSRTFGAIFVSAGLLSGIYCGMQVARQCADSPQAYVEHARFTLVGMHDRQVMRNGEWPRFDDAVFIFRDASDNGVAYSSQDYTVAVRNANNGNVTVRSIKVDDTTEVFEEEELTDTGYLVAWRSIADRQWRWRNWFFTRDADKLVLEFHVPKGTVKTRLSS